MNNTHACWILFIEYCFNFNLQAKCDLIRSEDFAMNKIKESEL